jgi:hypothetical protein
MPTVVVWDDRHAEMRLAVVTDVDWMILAPIGYFCGFQAFWPQLSNAYAWMSVPVHKFVFQRPIFIKHFTSNFA